MQYKISKLRVKNFKCFDDSRFYEFVIDISKNPVVMSGPNGFGKTTFFDAIEIIFSKQITRINVSIEKKNSNLGKNVLLNKANRDGYLVLTLINDKKECLTLFARIKNTVHKIDVENAIEYGVEERDYKTEELDALFNEYTNWKEDIVKHNRINFATGFFNIYYYISQAESVHFLKKAIADRKDTMNVMLNASAVSSKVDFINKLIGKKSDSKGVMVNDEIKRIEDAIVSKVEQFKKYAASTIVDHKDEVKYEQLLVYPVGVERELWDEQSVENLSIYELNRAITDIKALHSYVVNLKDIESYNWNKRISDLLDSDAIKDFIEFKDYFVDGKLDKDKVKHTLEKWDIDVQVFRYSSFFRSNKLDIKKYKSSDIIALNKLVPNLIDFDVYLANEIVGEIDNLQKLLSSNQVAIGELEDARNALALAKEKYNQESSECPYCNNKFLNVTDLNKAFNKVKFQLDAEKGKAFVRVIEKKEKLELLIKETKEKVLSTWGGYDDTKIKELTISKAKIQEFINQRNRVARVEFLIKFISDELFEGLDTEECLIRIHKIISNMYKNYDNPEFKDDYNKYHYEDLSNRYKRVLEEQQDKLQCKSEIDKKIDYLKKCICEKEDVQMVEIKRELKQMIMRKEKLLKVRQCLDELRKVYNNSIDEYKNRILKKLRVPLLIYTGKILQDYQGGLGVFINRDEMRFVSNNGGKLDVLNTFSSGQLSGFVLAFLFSMNKQYIHEIYDDIGFILIDDPVQTMDDINISSLVEVLRNDFEDKQIIMSTHEAEKENYILYKFYKYGMVGQSFNVKEKLYDI